jgi:hypothetical protein
VLSLVAEVTIITGTAVALKLGIAQGSTQSLLAVSILTTIFSFVMNLFGVQRVVQVTKQVVVAISRVSGGGMNEARPVEVQRGAAVAPLPHKLPSVVREGGSAHDSGIGA